MALSVLQQLDVDPRFIDVVTENVGAVVPIQAGALPKWTATRAKSKTVAKIVQSDSGYSTMTADMTLTDFRSYRAKQLGVVQLTESTRAENALEGERRRSGLTDKAYAFEFLSRNVCYDGASSLRKKERGWLMEHAGFNLFYTVCELPSLTNDAVDSLMKRPDIKQVVGGTVFLHGASTKG
jgi:hypothetical protein